MRGEELLQQAAQLVMLSLAVSAISMTLTKAIIFKWLRDLVKRLSRKLGELVSCPYCMSHWVSIGFVIFYGPVPLAGRSIDWEFQPIVDGIVTVFAVVTLAAFWSGLIYRAFMPMMQAEGEEDD